ncbi:MAG: DNA-deoxyinosine glycosylase [Pseudomonadota bacterium]
MATDLSYGFAPIVGGTPKILVLGSLPGARSLETGEYYAFPQNAFWPIMAELVGATGDYQQRCECLIETGIAVWDVLAASRRPGSMDADIDPGTAEANDFGGFFRRYPSIDRIGFNGQTATKLFDRLVLPQLETLTIARVQLPSTSPAYAAIAFDEKLRRWRDNLAL